MYENESKYLAFNFVDAWHFKTDFSEKMKLKVLIMPFNLFVPIRNKMNENVVC